MDIVGAVERLVEEVRAASRNKRHAALGLKQAALTLDRHLALARAAAGEEKDAEERAKYVSPISNDEAAALRAEQKAAAAAKQARIDAPKLETPKHEAP